MIFFQSLVLLLVLIFSGCGKKNKNNKLAQNYFKMAFYDLADSSKNNASYQLALQHINQALVHEKKAEYLALKGTILMYLGHTSQSEACFKQALLLPINDDGLREQILNNQACLLAQSGKTEEAKHVWQDLAGNPLYNTPEVAWVNIGKLHLSQQHLGSAVEAFKTAALLEPNYVDAHFYTAVAAHAAGKNGQADESLKAVLLLEPSHVAALELADRVLQKA